MKKIATAMPAKPAKRLECFVISRDGVYAENLSGVCSASDSEQLIKEAQALRFRVFAKEMGAKLKTESEGLDYDEVDNYCDHLIVYDNVKNKIAGYTRLLNQEQAERLGSFYSQNEFNLDRVLALPGRFLEIGRTCVDPEYRGGAVLTTLWTSLVQYALEGRFNYLVGCASIPAGPSGFAVDAVYRNIDSKNIAASSLQASPTTSVPMELRCERDESGVPPLLKAYFRFGAMVCGEPFWDENFNCMDLFMLLPLDQLQKRYSKHYMRDVIDRDRLYAPSQSETGSATGWEDGHATNVPEVIHGAGW